MLKFNQLTLAQKRFVVAAIESNSAYKKHSSITLKECSAIYDSVRLQRTGSRGEKIGYPNWLFANNKIERGVYQLPIPTDAELSQFQQDLNAKLSPARKSKPATAKVAKVKVAKAKKQVAVADEDSVDISGSRLVKTIEQMETVDADVEDFNAILRENGIEV
jgi:hypothetical protein